MQLRDRGARGWEAERERERSGEKATVSMWSARSQWDAHRRDVATHLMSPHSSHGSRLTHGGWAKKSTPLQSCLLVSSLCLSLSYDISLMDMSYVLWLILCLICLMYIFIYLISYVLYLMSYVLCLMTYLLCLWLILCLMSYILYILSTFLSCLIVWCWLVILLHWLAGPPRLKAD